MPTYRTKIKWSPRLFMHASMKRPQLDKEVQSLRYIALAKLAKESLPDLAESAVFKFFNLIRVAGFRVAEYAQTTQTIVDEFKYASGNRVIKAFIPTNWKFYDGKGRLIMTHSLGSLYLSVCKPCASGLASCLI